jgi:hypothetical protein
MVRGWEVGSGCKNSEASRECNRAGPVAVQQGDDCQAKAGRVLFSSSSKSRIFVRKIINAKHIVIVKNDVEEEKMVRG